MTTIILAIEVDARTNLKTVDDTAAAIAERWGGRALKVHVVTEDSAFKAEYSLLRSLRSYIHWAAAGVLCRRIQNRLVSQP